MEYYLVNLLHNIYEYELETAHPVVVFEWEELTDVVAELIEGQYTVCDTPVKDITIGTSFFDETVFCCMYKTIEITQEQFNFLKKVL